jgi:hypothetical protein
MQLIAQRYCSKRMIDCRIFGCMRVCTVYSVYGPYFGKIKMGLLLFNSKWATHQDRTLQITLMNEVYVFIKYIYLSLFVSFSTSS